MVDRHGASPARDRGAIRYGSRNFGSADYEPTDADLIELSHEAFAGIPEAREASLRLMRERIARRGAQVLAALEARLAGAAR